MPTCHLQASRGIVVDRDEGAAAPSSTHRRITPIPVGAGTLLPSSSATPAPAAEPPPPPEGALCVGAQGAAAKGGRVNIAALALQAGQQAARAIKQKP